MKEDVLVRHITDDERRARLAVRHALAPGARVATPELATRAVTVLHSTEPATGYLSLWARVPGLTIADVDRALFEDRSLVKQLAMRRTLFVFPRDLLPAAWGSASARVADTEGKRVAKDVVLAGLATDGDAWLDGARADVLAELEGDSTGLTASGAARPGADDRGQDRSGPAGRCGAPAGCSPTSVRPHTSSGASTRSTGGCPARAGR